MDNPALDTVIEHNTRSPVTAEIAHVGGRYTVHSRSLKVTGSINRKLVCEFLLANNGESLMHAFSVTSTNIAKSYIAKS